MSQSRRSPRARILPHELWRGIHETARSDAFGGILLLVATVAALVLANSPAAGWYEALRDFRFGFSELHLELSVGSWAADGLLAIFFFVVGLELKEEFVAGKLRDPRKAALPIAAAVGGVVVPAVIFLAVNAASGPEVMRGWAIPTATDIAFAVAVLAVVGRFLPPALRVFLLTLAIVDDLIAITIIALAYTESIEVQWLLLALLPLGLFALAVQRGIRAWWLLVPLAFVTWALVHASGVHATVAGVVLGFTVPVVATARAKVQVRTDPDGSPVYDGLAAHFADRWGLVATLFAVPVFAFFSAGVAIGGLDGLRSALADPVTVGIMAGLVLGKPIGILGVTFALTRLPSLALDRSLRWPDLVGMSFVAGIGFTVSLLVGELAFVGTQIPMAHVKIGVLAGSLLAALVGGALLAGRNRRARGTAEHVG
ncbi:Na+/H+ antiporter NhaA [Tessaracoccus rhinocerotis]|uniref:Na(+)/H(+) antiporter NhaA n=1 Tax=Tessaracoccus rhinocerotis TaxID=1689449 RepID=A0A553K4H6_9ACTN|nr:Na+/H+ antiporter NhaA [Tessaracoccus rhinocerotis]TRY19603.1 Na+/H+ antiporter NhaA [Tessaracoccus rhinocerotis]